MKAIKKLMLAATVWYLQINAQDSLTVAKTNQYYQNFFTTDVVAISDSGQNIILRDTNHYGKNEVKLHNNESKSTTQILNGGQYYFLDDQQLLIGAAGKVRFQNLKDRKTVDVLGSYSIHILREKGVVILFDSHAKLLSAYNTKGVKLWEKHKVDNFEFDLARKFVVLYSSSKVSRIDILDKVTASESFNGDHLKFKITKDNIYEFSKLASGIKLMSWNQNLKDSKTYLIDFPEGFELDEGHSNNLDVREGRYLFVPMEKKKMTRSSKPGEVIISYTNEKFSAFLDPGFSGVYDLLDSSWKWMPDQELESASQVLLNDKGDFLAFDVGLDYIENSENPLADMTLITHYGEKKYNIGKGHIARDNYYFDATSQTLIYFKDSQWWHYNLQKDKVTNLMGNINQDWLSADHHGLANLPVSAVIPITEKHKIIISGQYDLFLVDLKTLIVKRITEGENDGIVYNIIYRKSYSQDIIGDNDSGVQQGILLKIRNTRNYSSGYAIWDQKLKTLVYDDDNYTGLIKTGKHLFAISQSYQKPVRIKSIGSNDNTVIFDNKVFVKDQLKNLKMELFNYRTNVGPANGALLYPINYDPAKSYPMVVNIYEKKSKEVLYYSIPDLQADDGFNFLHYVHQGYFVLLPDLHYEVGKIPEGLLTSLEESVRVALGKANIDQHNLAVVGMSFGGFEAGLALSNTKLFKTGSVGSMISDLVSSALNKSPFLSQPNYMRIENEQIGLNESVFDAWEKYTEQSPIAHIKKINAPVLLWSGLKDQNVLPAQSKEYFMGLKRLSKKAVLLEYPLADHTLTTSEDKEDLTVKTWQWMEYFLKGNIPAEWIKPLIKKAPF